MSMRRTARSATVPAFGTASAGVATGPSRPAATGAFFQTADFTEWEKLEQRLTKLEGQISGTAGGYASFQAEFKVMTSNFATLMSRVGEVERMVQQVSASVNNVKQQQESFQTAELGRETRYQNLERQLSRMDGRMRAHSQNSAMHSHEDDSGGGGGVRGFRANDQPREFMGGR